MKELKLILSLLLVVYLSNAQDLVFNKGANVVIQGGAQVYVYGGWQNDGATAQLNHSGDLYLRNGTAPFRGSFTNRNGATTTLNNASRLFVQGDWTNDATFTANVGSNVIFDGVDEQVFTRDINANVNDGFYNVEINNTAPGNSTTPIAHPVGIWLNDNGLSNFVVNGTLTFTAGVISMNKNTTEVHIHNTATNAIIGYGDPPATTGEDDKYIFGTLVRDIDQTVGGIYDFPVGGLRNTTAPATTGTGIQLLEINVPANVTTAEVLSVNFTSQATTVPAMPECGGDYNTALDNGIWFVRALTAHTVSGTGTISSISGYDLRAHNRRYTTVTAAAFTLASNDGTGWQLLGDVCSGSTTADNVPRTNLPQTEIDVVTVYSTTPLPVSQLLLTAEPQNDHIAVVWTTQEEINNKGFELERSTDGINFQKIAWINGTQTTTPTAGQKYFYDDYNVEYDKLYYYRVKQIDFDGNYTYSNIASAKISTQKEFEVFLHPNPAQDELFMTINSTVEQNINIQVYDVIGKLLYNNNVEVKKGESIVELQDLMNRIAAGTYYVKVIPEVGSTFTTRLVKTD